MRFHSPVGRNLEQRAVMDRSVVTNTSSFLSTGQSRINPSRIGNGQEFSVRKALRYQLRHLVAQFGPLSVRSKGIEWFGRLIPIP